MKRNTYIILFIMLIVIFSLVISITIKLLRINIAYLDGANTHYKARPSTFNNSDIKSSALYEIDSKAENLSNGALEKSADATIFNIAFLGIDKNKERANTLGCYRTDTISVIHVDLYLNNAKVLSIPRDTRTFIPLINKMDKINHAYAYGSVKGEGIESSIEAINSLIKYSKIDHFFAIDIEPISEIVNALGGIDLDVEIETRTLKKGFQNLDGIHALEYIQYRCSNEGDIGRIKRQQKFICAMYNKLTSLNSIPDAIKIIGNYKEYIKTDLSIPQLLDLAEVCAGIASSDIHYYLLPGKAKYIDNISYWIPDEIESDNTLKSLFLNK